MSIDFDLTDGIATITINRPERMNAMDAEHYKGLSQAWTRVRDESAKRKDLGAFRKLGNAPDVRDQGKHAKESQNAHPRNERHCVPKR